MGARTEKLKKRRNCYELQALSLTAPFLIGRVQIHSPRPFPNLTAVTKSEYLAQSRRTIKPAKMCSCSP